MKSLILVFSALLALSLAEDQASYHHLWTLFKVEHKRNYHAKEEAKRFAIFRQNVDLIKSLNKRHAGKTTFALNFFADLTPEEKASYRNNITFTKQASPTPFKFSGKAIPSSVDWRTRNAVTPVVNQGPCGSSPYWSAVVSIEGAWAIAGNKLVALSAQQILDCSQPEGNAGCNGGEMTYSYQYVINCGGLESAADYPSQNGNPGNCSFDPKKVAAKIRSYVSLPGDERSMTQALAMVPIGTAVNAEDQGFEYYSSGVFSSISCGSVPPNHGIGVVGYGTQNGQDYYILKNQWGTGWGMNGYMYLARNKGNMCGIASYATYAVV